jgi:cell division protein FtsB
MFGINKEQLQESLNTIQENLRVVLEEQYKEVIGKYSSLKSEFISLQQDYAKQVQENLFLKARIKELEAGNTEQEEDKLNKYSDLANKLFNE